MSFDPKIERKLQQDEEWRIVAKSYLLDPGFFEGIQSLNLNDAQVLEDGKDFVKNPSVTMRKSLLNRTLQIKKDFDRYSKVEDGTSNALTYMWLRMATMVNWTVEKRKATNPDDSLRSQKGCQYCRPLYTKRYSFQLRRRKNNVSSNADSANALR